MKPLADLKIIGASFEDTGVGWYRLLQPLAAAKRHLGIQTDSLPFEGKNNPLLDPNLIFQALNLKLAKADVLWTTKVYQPEQIQIIAQLRSHHQFSWWMDLDDNLIDVNPDSPVYTKYFPYVKWMLWSVKHCDVLTVSTPELVAFYRQFRPKKPIIITPNFVDEQLWAKGKPKKPLMVGFAGAAGHEEDLALLRNVLPRPDCQFALFGQRYAVPKPDIYYHWVNLIDYFQYYPSLGWSIAVAPLRQNVYNRCKSNLRIIEAGIQGVPVIASPVDPYLNLPVRYASSEADWQRHLDELLASPRLRKQEGQALRDHVLSFYSSKPFAEQFKHLLTTTKGLYGHVK